MPLYKTGLDMWKKYQAKFDPTTIGNRFTQVQSLALDRAQEGLNMVGTIREFIRPILDNHAVAGGMRANYLAFATALMKHTQRQKGSAANKIASGLKQYFVNAYDLDPEICDEIIQVVVGWVTVY